MNYKKGFTLIEILIVVAIIGILASVVLVGLGPVQRRGRDARRISDLRQVQTGLELYYGKDGVYPLTQADWKTFSGILTSAPIGVSSVPIDPSSGQSYVYTADTSGTKYVLEAHLEDGTNPAISPSQTNALDSNCGTAPYYCVQL